MNFAAYTLTLQPAHFGEGWSDEERAELASRIASAMRARFPGLEVRLSRMEGASTPTRGPDAATIEEIEAETGGVFDQAVEGTP